MEAWFISDIHLKSVEERNGQTLLRFLHSLRDSANVRDIHLFMLGDIFDLWVGGHQYFANKFAPLVEGMKELLEAGAKVTYIEGNHDVHVESFFQKKLGVSVFVEAQYYTMGDLVVRCEHGDLINTEDAAYLKYRGIIRNPWIKPLGRLLPGVFWDYIGDRASRKSRVRSGHYRQQNEYQLVEMVRSHAVRAYAERPFDIIISGHMHVFDDHTIDMPNRRIRSINLGSWLEGEVKVFRLKDGHAEWVSLT